jgi:hypothetical protein
MAPKLWASATSSHLMTLASSPYRPLGSGEALSRHQSAVRCRLGFLMRPQGGSYLSGSSSREKGNPRLDAVRRLAECVLQVRTWGERSRARHPLEV